MKKAGQKARGRSVVLVSSWNSFDGLTEAKQCLDGREEKGGIVLDHIAGGT